MKKRKIDDVGKDESQWLEDGRKEGRGRTNRADNLPEESTTNTDEDEDLFYVQGGSALTQIHKAGTRHGEGSVYIEEMVQTENNFCARIACGEAGH